MSRKRAFYLAESEYKQKAQNDYDEANETYTILYETRKLKVVNTGRNADEATTEGGRRRIKYTGG